MTKFKKGQYYAIRHSALTCVWGKIVEISSPNITDYPIFTVDNKYDHLSFTLAGCLYNWNGDPPALHPTLNKHIVRYLYD